VGFIRWLLIGLGLAGALVVAQPGASGSSPYALLGLITALASAVRDLLSRKAPADAPGLVVTFAVIVCVLAASLINTLLFENWKPVTGELAFYALGSGFFVTVAHFFVFMSFRLATARAVAPFYYTFTLIAALFGAIFFNEWPNVTALAGIAMIIACGLGVLLFEKRDVKP
jgi:drug/metabolite transporter (DMT)-like permease